MSSHHFVKEGQEPALLIIDRITFTSIEPLLEWAPLVMVEESLLDNVLGWGIKIDVALVRPESIELTRQKLLLQAPVKILSHHAGDDPIRTALYFLISLKQSSVNITGSWTPELVALAEDFLPRISISLIDNNLKWSGRLSGSFEKWLPAGTEFHVRSQHRPVVIEGVRETGSAFQTTSDGVVKLRFDGPFWVGETL